MNNKYSENIKSMPHSYNKAVFFWLDILGFSDDLQNELKYHDLAKTLEQFQVQFKEAKHCHSKVISDGIVLWLEFPSHNTLRSVFKYIAEQQMQFILQSKKFLRGGIALGSHMDMKNGNIISSGFAKAVKAEEKFVTWPVIGMLKKELEEIKKHLNLPEDETFELTHTFNDSGEDIFFIDFMKESSDMLSLIIGEIVKFSHDENQNMRIRAKYIFLLKYYIAKYDVQSLQLPKDIEEAIL